jgi:hypothetical protein
MSVTVDSGISGNSHATLTSSVERSDSSIFERQTFGPLKEGHVFWATELTRVHAE